MDLTEQEARRQIHDCVLRSARGVDRHDPELTLSAYHEGAHDDHGYFVGPAREFAYRAVESHAGWPSHMHYVLNHFVEFDPADARAASAETYWIMVARTPSHEVELSGGRYVDRFEERGGRWAIANRVCIVEWTSNPGRMPELLSAFVAGTQDRNDPSYRAATLPPRAFRDVRPFRQAPPE